MADHTVDQSDDCYNHVDSVLSSSIASFNNIQRLRKRCINSHLNLLKFSEVKCEFL